MRRASDREQTFVPGSFVLEPSKAEVVEDEDAFADVLADVALSKEEQLKLLLERSSNFYIKKLVFQFSPHD